eukprot:SAG31_NODE_41785_length_274_cov_0.891429_1_plen_25_part_01
MATTRECFRVCSIVTKPIHGMVVLG